MTYACAVNDSTAVMTSGVDASDCSVMLVQSPVQLAWATEIDDDAMSVIV